VYHLLQKNAESYNAEYILVDMSPSLGPLNQNLLSICDYFIVPLHPDYFSAMALRSLANVLPRWKKWADTAYHTEALVNADYPFPKPRASFAGAIVQKYRPRNGQAGQAFQKCINQLTDGLESLLIPTLERESMLDSESFSIKAGQVPSKPILEMPDFNSLIALSQDYQVPVYKITQAQARQAGAVWQNTQESMQGFCKAFSDCADIVIRVTQDEAN